MYIYCVNIYKNIYKCIYNIYKYHKKETHSIHLMISSKCFIDTIILKYLLLLQEYEQA